MTKRRGTTSNAATGGSAEPYAALAIADGKTKPNETFAALCSSSPYNARIQKLLTDGVTSGGTETVHGIVCRHDTQPSANVTVWYNWQGNAMIVYGVGSHTGGNGARNSSYQMTWFNGKNKTWTRG